MNKKLLAGILVIGAVFTATGAILVNENSNILTNKARATEAYLEFTCDNAIDDVDEFGCCINYIENTQADNYLMPFQYENCFVPGDAHADVSGDGGCIFNLEPISKIKYFEFYDGGHGFVLRYGNDPDLLFGRYAFEDDCGTFDVPECNYFMLINDSGEDQEINFTLTYTVGLDGGCDYAQTPDKPEGLFEGIANPVTSNHIFEYISITSEIIYGYEEFDSEPIEFYFAKVITDGKYLYGNEDYGFLWIDEYTAGGKYFARVEEIVDDYDKLAYYQLEIPAYGNYQGTMTDSAHNEYNFSLFIYEFDTDINMCNVLIVVTGEGYYETTNFWDVYLVNGKLQFERGDQCIMKLVYDEPTSSITELNYQFKRPGTSTYLELDMTTIFRV